MKFLRVVLDIYLMKIARATERLKRFGQLGGLIALTALADPGCSKPVRSTGASTATAPAQPATISSKTPTQPTLVQEMTAHDNAWQTSQWSNGQPFNNTWRSDQVSFRDGRLVITLSNDNCPFLCDNRPYASGEYRTTAESYKYGLYEVRMKAATGQGLVSSFFVYTGKYGQKSHHEIDLEILGKDCGLAQTNYYVAGRGKHEEMITLGFNACTDFHDYSFKWEPGAITWSVDGKLKRKVTGGPDAIPAKPGKIMVNLWAGIGVDGWLGRFKYPGQPLEAQYDWVRFTPAP